MNAWFEKQFKLSEHGTDVRTEILAGITTFMTMAYIIFVNPGILSTTGMPFGSLLVATCLGASLATFLMAFLANYPFALAPGMGLNAFFAFTVVLGMKIPWQVALAAIFIEGVIFILLTCTKVREEVVNSIEDAEDRRIRRHRHLHHLYRPPERGAGRCQSRGPRRPFAAPQQRRRPAGPRGAVAHGHA